MSRHPYLSGFCGIGRHAVCTITYGHPERPARCSCRCHKDPAPPPVDGQLDLLPMAKVTR
jgi:hypothetical protein